MMERAGWFCGEAKWEVAGVVEVGVAAFCVMPVWCFAEPEVPRGAGAPPYIGVARRIVGFRGHA